MSEYQYYEFQAIDRPLTADEQRAVSNLSSRVDPHPRRAVFVYHRLFQSLSEEGAMTVMELLRNAYGHFGLKRDCIPGTVNSTPRIRVKPLVWLSLPNKTAEFSLMIGMHANWQSI